MKLQASLGLSALCFLGLSSAALAGQTVTLGKFKDQVRKCVDQYVAAKLLPTCSNDRNNTWGGTIELEDFNAATGEFVYTKTCDLDQSEGPTQARLYLFQKGNDLKVQLSYRGLSEVKKLKLSGGLRSTVFKDVKLAYVARGEDRGRVDRSKSILSEPEFPLFMAIYPFPDSALTWYDEGARESKYKINLKAFGDCTAKGL